MKDQAVLKRKRRNDTCREMMGHYRNTNHRRLQTDEKWVVLNRIKIKIYIGIKINIKYK